MSKRLLKYLTIFLTYCVVTSAVGWFLLQNAPNPQFFTAIILGGILFTFIFWLLGKLRRRK